VPLILQESLTGLLNLIQALWYICLGSNHPWDYLRFLGLLLIFLACLYINKKLLPASSTSSVQIMTLSQLFSQRSGWCSFASNLFSIFLDSLDGLRDLWLNISIVFSCCLLLQFILLLFLVCSFDLLLFGNCFEVFFIIWNIKSCVWICHILYLFYK